MNIPEIFEIVGAQCSAHVDAQGPYEVTRGFLSDALATFAVNRMGATRSICELQARDPALFVIAALGVLVQAEDSPATQFLTGLVFSNELLIEPLCNAAVLSESAAISLARKVTAVVPMLDVKLAQRVNMPGVEEPDILRILAIVEAVSDGRRLLTYDAAPSAESPLQSGARVRQVADQRRGRPPAAWRGVAGCARPGQHH